MRVAVLTPIPFLGRKQTITYGNICGYAVNKPVDNRIQVRITAAVLWIKKNLSIILPWGLRSTPG
jgi:hypothetical protein